MFFFFLLVVFFSAIIFDWHLWRRKILHLCDDIYIRQNIEYITLYLYLTLISILINAFLYKITLSLSICLYSELLLALQQSALILTCMKNSLIQHEDNQLNCTLLLQWHGQTYIFCIFPMESMGRFCYVGYICFVKHG